MAYFTLQDLKGLVPDPFLTEALDDDSDGTIDEDVFAQLQTDASDSVHSALGGRYSTPFTPIVPAIVREAAKVFAANQIYTRRGKEAPASLVKRADQLRAQLIEIGKGAMPLDPNIDRARPSASAITEPSLLGDNSQPGGRKLNI
jgi:phage gp36-like protein